jgi:hypothetical protein
MAAQALVQQGEKNSPGRSFLPGLRFVAFRLLHVMLGGPSTTSLACYKDNTIKKIIVKKNIMILRFR